MFVIFEGCDGTGKSSLAAAVADRIRQLDSSAVIHEIHRGPLTRPPLDEYVHDVSFYTPGADNHVVADRWHWGEEIYGPIYREGSAATLAQFRWMDLWLTTRGADVWHVSQPLDRLQKRLEARGEDFLQSHHVATVRDLFSDLAGSSATSAGTIEPEGDTRALVERIVTRAQYSENAVLPLKKYPSYVGRTLPHTLLVGEQRGGKPPYVTESAFMPVGGNSADFLLSALDSNWWKGIGLVNAVDAGDSLFDLVNDLYGPRVVALGRTASDILLDLGIEHGGVPHPQHVRRFHNKKKLEYGMLIREHARTGDIKFSWPT